MRRRPVELVYYQARITDAVAAERQLKGWSRAKKKALITGDLNRLRVLAKRRKKAPHPPGRGRRPLLRMRRVTARDDGAQANRRNTEIDAATKPRGAAPTAVSRCRGSMRR